MPDARPLTIQPLEVQLQCEGFYGFGAGYAIAKGMVGVGGVTYCTTCPLRAPCWFRHRGRVMFLFPVVSATFIGLVEQYRMDRPEGAGTLAMKTWFDEHKMPDPFSQVMIGNIEDGNRVGSGLAPKDRGAMTLPPLPLIRDGSALKGGA